MLFQDFRYAVRSLWHSKGFAIVAILCLGIGIGLNTTIFSIADGVLLKPYPFTNPDRLLVVGEENIKTNNEAGLPYLDMRDWKEASSSLAGIAASQAGAVTISDGSGEPERHLGAAISWDLFPLLGVAPLLGRGFTAADDLPNAPGTVLLSHTLWASRYQNDPSILGRRVLVSGRLHTIIGVMPEHFEFPENQHLWTPLGPAVATDTRANRSLFALARMKPAVTREQATGELNAIAARLAREYPATNAGWSARVRSLREEFLPPEVPLVMSLMMTGVTLVLFIAGSNVANLMMARATGRRREFAVRAAIGAGRARIVRQLLTESLVLGLASVPLGILLAEIGTRVIASAMPVDEVPYYIRWTVDLRTFVYAVGVASLTAIVFGLFPALQVSREDLHESLKEGTRGAIPGRSRLRSSLVVAQVSLALVALVGALLFVRTFVNLDTYELGFETRPLMTLRFYMTGDSYEVAGARSRRVEDVVRRVEAIPNVRAVFASSLIPIDGGGGGGPIEFEGRTIAAGLRPSVRVIGVTPGFYETLGASMLRGRDFTPSEGWSKAPVAVITQTMAKRFWPDGDAIDRRFRLIRRDDSGDWLTVIGIAPDLRLFGIDPQDTQPEAAAFVPYGHGEATNTGLTIRVASSDPASVTASVRDAIRASDPNIPLYRVRTMEEVRSAEFWQYGIYGWIFGTIGVTGLLLAAVGVYGVISYSVSQRTQEIGMRMAMGAMRSDVLTLVVGQGLLLTGAGVVIGIGLAGLGMPVARSLLYEVSPFDPISFGSVIAFLGATAFVASYVPALRATRVDPVVVLRGE